MSAFGANALVRFNPKTRAFTRVRLPSSPGNVRQLLGGRGEVWVAESAVDKLVLVLAVLIPVWIGLRRS